jgi:hypothetical protein
MAPACSAVALLLVVAAVAGCSSTEGQVSGVVTVDGEEVKSGAITFVPVDGKGTTTGGKIENGRYSVRVPVGRMKVSISEPRESHKKKVYATPNSPEMPVYKEWLPDRYNEKTELTLEVKAGTNRKDWPLTRKKQ